VSPARAELPGDYLAQCRRRAAAGEEPCRRSPAVRAHLRRTSAAPVLGRPLTELGYRVMDWRSSTVVEADPANGHVLIGRYREDRSIYTTDAYATPGGERRTVHLGVDLCVPPGHPVHAPLDGVVEAFGDNAAPLDYGPVIVLRHELPDGEAFFTLYGHLSRASLETMSVGSALGAGQQFAAVGMSEENGGWPSHLHLQILTDLVGMGLDVPGVAARGELPVWTSLSPDPNLLLRLPDSIAAP
jgi:murein DD-endopeptidase MepM/ murein hydrolase activator NlpD